MFTSSFMNMVSQKDNILEETHEKYLDDANICSSGKVGAPLFSWPWQNLGSYKACYYYYY